MAHIIDGSAMAEVCVINHKRSSCNLREDVAVVHVMYVMMYGTDVDLDCSRHSLSVTQLVSVTVSVIVNGIGWPV